MQEGTLLKQMIISILLVLGELLLPAQTTNILAQELLWAVNPGGGIGTMVTGLPWRSPATAW
jgi:hypothetical protein